MTDWDPPLQTTVCSLTSHSASSATPNGSNATIVTTYSDTPTPSAAGPSERELKTMDESGIVVRLQGIVVLNSLESVPPAPSLQSRPSATD